MSATRWKQRRPAQKSPGRALPNPSIKGKPMKRKSRNNGGSTASLGDQTVLRGQGGETHQVASGDAAILTTQQGVPVSDDQNTLKMAHAGRRRWRTSIFARRFSISITSASRNASSMPAGSAPTAFSKPMSRYPISRARTSSSAHAKRRPLLCGFQRLPVIRAQQIWRATYAGSP